MRTIPTFLSALAVLWAASAALRSPLAWPVPTYVTAHSFFVIVAWMAIRQDGNGSNQYAWFHGVSLFSLLVLAMACTGYFLKAFPFGLAAFVIFGMLAAAVAGASVTYWELLKICDERIPGTLLAAVWQAALLCFCGAASFSTAFAQVRPEIQASAIALGVFWFLTGLFLMGYCVGIIRTETVFDQLNHYVPQVLAMLAFGLLAYRLDSLRIGPVGELVKGMVAP